MSDEGDVIELSGLRCIGVVGVLPEERVRPQPIEIDIEVAADLAPAGNSDALEDTLDYALIAAVAERQVRTGGFTLLEALAEAICAELTTDPRVRRVTVAVRKVRPPVPYDLASCGVRLTRPGASR